MICVHATKCQSECCPHRLSHSINDFCREGSCKWGHGTACRTESKREEIEILVNELIMDDRFNRMQGQELVDRIVEIVEEVAA